MNMLQSKHISIDLSHTRIISDVSVEITEGEFVGPNGSGKTTLLRGLHRSLKPAAGSIFIQSVDLWHISASEHDLAAAVAKLEIR